MTDYQKQAEDFLIKADAKIEIELSKNQSAPLWAKEGDDYGLKYDITITRLNKKPYKFNFWNSIASKEKINLLDDAKAPIPLKLANGKIKLVYNYDFGYMHAKQVYKKRIESGEFNPTSYDILACLTKHDPQDFENFCADYGYDTDSRLAEKIFLAVDKEWHAVNNMFGDVLEELAEIN